MGLIENNCRPCYKCGSNQLWYEINGVDVSSASAVWIICKHCANSGPPAEVMDEGCVTSATLKRAIEAWNIRGKILHANRAVW